MPTPPPLSSYGARTRALHEGIDAHMRATGTATLHPESPTILPDLFGTAPMAAWQEGKAAMAFLHEQCWSELPPVYARYGTDAGLELILAMRRLYDAPGALITDCGAQAVALAIDGLLRPGGHAILARQIYGKTRVYLEWAAERLGATITIVDEVDAASLTRAARPETTLVLCETYSNPLTRALDPDAISAATMALRAGGSPALRVVVDDTIATPWGLKTSLLARPGIDVVVGAGTKAVAGRDLDTFGYLVGSDVAWLNQVMDLQAARGGTLSWRSARVIVDGLDEARQLHATRCANATRIATFLADHAAVEEVHHPSLPGHPDRAVVDRVYARPGSMVSFKAADLDEDATRHLCDVIAMTTVWRYALSFDGLVSKVNHHRTVSEHFTPAPRLRRQGIDRIVRLGVGVEDADDLVHALDWALAHHAELTADDVRAWQRDRATALGLPPA